MSIKVGDVITFRQWDDMAQEFGVSSSGVIRTAPFRFDPRMKYLCGQKITVKYISAEQEQIFSEEGFEYDFGSKLPICWRFCASMFEESRTAESFNEEKVSDETLLGFLFPDTI